MSNASVFNWHRAVDRKEQPQQGLLGFILRLVQWSAALFVAAMVVNIATVTMLWDKNVEPLGDVLKQEVAQLELGPEDRATAIISDIVQGTYELVFVKSGLQGVMYTTQDDFLKTLVVGYWWVFQAFMVGLQLFALRLAVLGLSLPLFLAVGLVALTDGAVVWYKRRTSASRESGFLYHRAKRTFPAMILALWLIYLVPPVVMDPCWIIPPFLFAFGAILRLQVAYFKKYL